MWIVFSCFKVLGIVEGKLTVELQSKIEPIPEKQKWLREKMQGNWFSLKNAKTEKYLTAFDRILSSMLLTYRPVVSPYRNCISEFLVVTVVVYKCSVLFVVGNKLCGLSSS